MFEWIVNEFDICHGEATAGLRKSTKLMIGVGPNWNQLREKVAMVRHGARHTIREMRLPGPMYAMSPKNRRLNPKRMLCWSLWLSQQW